MASSSTPAFTAARAITWDAENAAATLHAQGLTKILPCESYLASSDFPNTTTLYGWHVNATSDSATISNWIGAKDLTRTGALTQQADHLGNSVYCEFDGTNDYLSSSDAAFNTTGTFSLGLWAYSASWSSITSQMLIARVNSSWTNGWYVAIDTNGFHIWTNPASTNYGGHVKALPAGWHHFAISRTNGGNTNFYINGKWSGTVATTSFTAGGNLEIATAAAGAGAKFNGRISEVVFHSGTAWTEGEARKIYARGARRLAALDSNGTVQIPQNELRVYPIRKLVFSGTPAGWNPVYAYGRPSVDALGNWDFEFWMRASFNATNANSFTINGITAKSVGQDQACIGYSTGGSVVSYCEVGDNSGTFYYGFRDSTTGTAIMIYGKIMLASAPTI
jgi:hypothetical protein